MRFLPLLFLSIFQVREARAVAVSGSPALIFGSTVTIMAPNGNTTPIPITGSLTITESPGAKPVTSTSTWIAGVTGAIPTTSTNTILGTGAAIVGRVGIDQTTPGTTNKVSIGTDGTVTANATLAAETTKVIGTVNQGGTWTVQPGNTANTTAWKVDGSAVTQPVSGTFFQAVQPTSLSGSGGAITTTSTSTFLAGVSGAIPTTSSATIISVAVGALPTTSSSTVIAAAAGAIPTTSSSTVIVAAVGAVPTTSTSTVLAPGSAIVGSVGIDQTTPGTTNKVSIGSDGTVAAVLGAETTKVIGTINLSAGQTLGALTAISNALPSGGNVLGIVIPSISSISAYNLPGSTMAVNSSSTNITSIGGLSLDPGPYGGYPLPARVDRLERLAEETNFILSGIKDLLLELLEAARH